MNTKIAPGIYHYHAETDADYTPEQQVIRDIISRHLPSFLDLETFKVEGDALVLPLRYKDREFYGHLAIDLSYGEPFEGEGDMNPLDFTSQKNDQMVEDTVQSYNDAADINGDPACDDIIISLLRDHLDLGIREVHIQPYYTREAVEAAIQGVLDGSIEIYL